MRLQSKPVIEGAGVRLNRVFGEPHKELDPFLLLDHFKSDKPEDYIKGFPWHPHRGIETVTYMIAGSIEHGDSLGNRGVINDGDVQWMTAGSGIIHQEMPERYKGTLQGFQLWVNLPRAKKMMHPRYRGILADEIPVQKVGNNKVKVIAGEFDGTLGPVQDLVVECKYLDVSCDKRFEAKVTGNGFAYVFEGSGEINGHKVNSGELVTAKDNIDASGRFRFLLAMGRPLREPVAWGGPIVMNTKPELKKAFEELDKGTFIKSKHI